AQARPIPDDDPPTIATHPCRPRSTSGRVNHEAGSVGGMKRTIVAGGTVATDSAVFAADVVIDDGRVAALAEPGTAGTCDELIDATGLVVLPGAIDPHAHFEDPGHTEREDFTTGTMAAAAGGITTVIEHPL